MTALLLALLAEALLGGAVVCAEARGLCPEEQAAVGAVVRERVAQSGRTGTDVLLTRRAFARPCRLRQLEPGHVAAYLRGRLGLGPPWAEGAVAFHARRLDRRIGPRWARRGWVVAHQAQGHTYYTGRL